MLAIGALWLTCLASLALSHLYDGNILTKRADPTRPVACVANISPELVYSDEVPQTSAVKDAIKQIEDQLKANFSSSPNSFTLSIVHSSSPKPLFEYAHGALRLNETSAGSSAPQVSIDSIFRTNSISKLFTALSVVVLQNSTPGNIFNWNSRLKDHLKSFHLPTDDWNNGGSEISFDMLATHTSGLSREGVLFNFSLPKGVGAASGGYTDKTWASATPESVVEYIGKRGLLWAPGSQPAYSNAGFALLGYAVAAFASSSSSSSSFSDRAAPLTFGEWAAAHILTPLNLSHSFFGAIPTSLTKDISVPADASGLEHISGPGYDPAVGLWSSTADLARLVHHVLLARDPFLITRAQRSAWMTPRYRITDNSQGVGQGWEIDFLPTANTKYVPPNGVPKITGPAVEEVYGKLGDGGGQHSSLTVVPALGYGIVIQTSTGNATGYKGAAFDPSTVALALHSVLAPAFRSSFAEMLQKKVLGTYEPLVNSSVGAPTPFQSWGTYTTTEANPKNSSVLLSLDSAGNLRLHNLTWNGLSALRQIDALSWAPGSKDGPTYFNNKDGVILHPSYARKDTWHVAVDPGNKCDWQDFAGYSDENGVALDEVRLSLDGIVAYDPLGARFRRKGGTEDGN